MPSPTGLIIYSIVIGLMDGGVEILLPVMTLDLVGSEKMTIAWGCLLAVISFSGLGPPIAGKIVIEACYMSLLLHHYIVVANGE